MSTREQEIALYLSPPSPCSYLPERESRSLFIDPQFPMTTAVYAQLLDQGFRRNGAHVYRPHCHQCDNCHSTRLAVAEFSPNRSQRRALKANADIEVIPVPAEFNAEHFALYQRYTATRHGEGEMKSMGSEQYLAFLQADWCQTEFLELRLGKRLLGVAVTDILPDGLSAVYTFFDPTLAERSLGTFSILSQVGIARHRKLSWIYLGYWIPDCNKMRYKSAYRPLEILMEGAWHRFAAGENIPLHALADPESTADSSSGKTINN